MSATTTVSEVVTFKEGLEIPPEAVRVFWNLEKRGFTLKLGDGRPFTVLVRPSQRLTPADKAAIYQHREALAGLVRSVDQGVRARRETFCRELKTTPDTIGPFLFRPGVPYGPGVCFSCGDGLERARFGRCWRCSLAWRLACRLPIPAELARAYDESKVVA